MSHPLTALVIDDERPALDELTFLLGHDARVGEVLACDSATEALRLLHDREVDVVFLDIQMPGLSGLDLAQVLARFRVPPPVVFVTAHEQHAVEAFDLNAVDYVLKPVRAERLAEAVRRVVVVGGDEDDRGRRPEPGQHARQVDPGQPGHPDVGEDRVDALLLEDPQGLGGRAGGQHAADPRVAAEQEDQLVEGRRLVVDDQHPQAHACTPGAYFGTRTVTFVPAPGAVSTTRP